jgi:tetratricopeptide (TPR) repeat protein
MKVIFGFMLCTLFMTVGLSAQQTNETEVLRNKIESLEQKLHEIDKDNTKILTAFERQDKRFEDLNSSTIFYSVLITILVAFLTIGVTVFNVLYSLFYAKKINKETEEATNKFVKEWAETKADETLEKIDNFIEKEKGNITKTTNEKVAIVIEKIEKSAIEKITSMEQIKKDTDEKVASVIKEIDKIATMEEIKKDTYNISKISMLFKQAFTAYNEGEYQEAIKIYKELIEQFKNSINEEIQIRVVSAMCDLGVAFSEIQQIDEAIKTYKELIDKYQNSKNEEIQIQVARAMFDLGIVFYKIKKIEEAVKTHKGLINKFDGSTNIRIKNILLGVVAEAT